MTIFSYVRSIYALETLDTRFTSSSSVPYKAAADTEIETAATSSKKDDAIVPLKLDRRGRPTAQPSKWNTPEFYIYYLIFIICVPLMFWIPYTVSRPSDPNYKKYKHLLQRGWIPGRQIDVSDAQYSTFRQNFAYLALLLLFHPLLRRLYESYRPVITLKNPSKPNGDSYVTLAEGEARLEQRASFDHGFAILFLAALHGFSALKILLILYMNFCIATKLPRAYIPAVTWAFNIGILFANELSGGYRFSKIAAFMSPSGDVERGMVHQLVAWLDSYGGIMSRWEILFNITVLRLISFNLDHYWRLDRRSGSPVEASYPLYRLENCTNWPKKKQLDIANLSERDRIATPAAAKDYSFRNMVAYALYAPVYLTGPIISFNDYISQLKYPPNTIETSRTIKYGIRFLLCLLTMELVLHFDYCVAISKADPDWSDYTPAQLCMLSYFNLHIIWLKLLLPWRLARLWALIDGVDASENMVRCMSNNPYTMAFWRGWHRSFNRWLTRYIYIPLGGASTKTWMSTVRTVINYVIVFTFVALWHDISLNLLIWGWLIIFFMMPEVIAGYLFPRRKWEHDPETYRILCGIGSVGNIMMMLSANLVGFAVGVDGLKSIVQGIIHEYSGMLFLATAMAALFVGAQVMFEVREGEMRKGIFMKC